MKISKSSAIFNRNESKLKEVKFNEKAYLKGVYDVLSDKNFKISKVEANIAISLFEDSIKVEKAIINYQKGQSFLAINKTHKSINVSKTGLQYEKVNDGEGLKPTMSNRVVVNYKGYTTDNKVFQTNTYNNPDTLLLSETIPGFREGLQLMTEGSRYKFYIPTELAYGPMPPPNTPIKPMMPVIFEVELIKVLK
ncbi:MAG: FKBP-type peptidyl-prolyl cis-trans isomerase [Spirosomaceae bacterium]|jgi:FKBP-type peptidyl-prolyl cis-trans isomerase|nr:FKBP-type peptidyl-prolyl cis-trans isomerase [Spirosomataceae bacterium]